ncbi:MAG: hypothetical protein A3I75_05115 [Deltaproteobacteria bacterium RIFCSPLOWO2_02_FULL_50_16]|nr:MAG: hypothetical protein A3I75_05115 [Deltaproteobacteria bacterium RIFCSPLOWO2_02_FULL_50_16]
MLAFFSVAPSDHWEHMSLYVAKSLEIIQLSGLSYQLGPMGTTVEGEPEAVFELIKKVHIHMRQYSKRISTMVKVDDDVTRPSGRLQGKVASVKEKLGKS